MTLNHKLLISSLLVILAVSLMVKIDFVTADLGRHIKNGEIILIGTATDRNAVLATNFYSYTEGNARFINHHWLSGVVFYIFYKLSGFSGLSLLYIVGMLLAFWLMIDLARKKVGPIAILTIALIAIPIIASRAEVRPEVFSYLFTAIFIWICTKYSEGSLGTKWLLSLPFIQILWVNLHIGFVFGPFIIGAYLVGAIAERSYTKVKRLTIILLTTCLVSLINPAGIYGILYPFQIFDIYTYRVFENQSINFLNGLGVGNTFTFFTYKTLISLVLVSYVLAAIKNLKKISIPILIMVSVFGYMGWSAIRDFPTFGLVAILALAVNLGIIYGRDNGRLTFMRNETLKTLACVSLWLIGAICSIGLLANRSTNFGIGEENGTNSAGNFFRNNNLHGPIFNNYDIGGYLIYNLNHDEKVYFDNRPEAYSKTFVDEEYINALEDPKVFDRMDKKYNFNTIFFYYRDYTPWGQEFITKKVFDSDWASVYADDSIIILLRRNSANLSTIKKFEISHDSFRITQ